jgi:hypothetical protein
VAGKWTVASHGQGGLLMRDRALILQKITRQKFRRFNNYIIRSYRAVIRVKFGGLLMWKVGEIEKKTPASRSSWIPKITV